MKIYIPEHLRELPIIKNLYELIVGYQESGNYEEYVSNFSDFYGFYLMSDPVKRFIQYVIPMGATEDGEVYINKITYLSQLFYCVKGTHQVIEYFIKFFGHGAYLDINNIEYNGRNLKIELNNISVPDEKYFNDLLKDFFTSLLYFESFGSIVTELNLEIKDEVESNISSKNINYREINV